ncbi:deoxynucleotide monophosphate kinase family protein [Streptomyces fungicidicus]|uniref:deoxynucleotide monophosphate kinase family protein n=1 Tax=Streptomyces fungicidicus TaxID=68203 RepID=UPI0036AA08E8
MAPRAPHIGLIGKARSGKDTAAQRMIQTSAYTRLAFADPLKEALLRLDPMVSMWGDSLKDVVLEEGWEGAKRYPEVRRLLQNYGQTIRELDPEFWVRELSRKVAAAHAWNLPVVVTDVRYRNEAEALQRAGFYMVHVVRPDNPGIGEAGTHASETELDDWVPDIILRNTGTVETFQRNVDILLQVTSARYSREPRS